MKTFLLLFFVASTVTATNSTTDETLLTVGFDELSEQTFNLTLYTNHITDHVPNCTSGKVLSMTVQYMTLDLGSCEATQVVTFLANQTFGNVTLQNVEEMTLLFLGEELAENIFSCTMHTCVDVGMFGLLLGGSVLVGACCLWCICAYCCGSEDEEEGGGGWGRRWRRSRSKYSIIKQYPILGDKFSQ